MKTLSLFTLLSSCVFIFSCSSNGYVTNTSNDLHKKKQNLVEDEFKIIVAESSGVGDRLFMNSLPGLFFNVEEVNDYSIFSTKFSSKSELGVIHGRIRNLCDRMDGKLHNGGCSKDDRLLFYYQLREGGYNKYAEKNSSILLAAYSENHKSDALISFAREQGYKSYEEEVLLEISSQEAEKKARHLAQKRKLEAQREMERKLNYMKEYSQSTRKIVMMTGSRICKVTLKPVAGFDVGFTEGQANGKIKIRNYNGKIIWDRPENWYLCENR